MKIKIDSLLLVKDNSKFNSSEGFRIKDIWFMANENSLIKDSEDLPIVRCLKYLFEEENNIMNYTKICEVVESNFIIGNNFWNEEYFMSTCIFEFRNVFDFTDCKLTYL